MTGPEPAAAPRGAARPRVARHLSRLARQLRGGPRMNLGAVLDHLGPASFGLALVLLALLALVPVPGLFGVVFGLALVLVAAQLVAGQPRPWLPERIRRLGIPAGPLSRGIRRSLPWLRRIERWHAPDRLTWLTGPVPGRLAGVAMMGLGVAIMLPIPLANLLPSAAVVMIAFALMMRDGLALVAGLVVAVLSLGWAVAILWFGADLLGRLAAFV
jgi:hypothetical protein